MIFKTSVARALRMDIKALSDVQKQIFQNLVEKLIARNKFPPSEAEDVQKLLENVRDAKNFHKIMEKLKECGQLDLDIEENFREGDASARLPREPEFRNG